MATYDIGQQHRSGPAAGRRRKSGASENGAGRKFRQGAGQGTDTGALRRLYRLIRDCLPLLLAKARYPSRLERQHQQGEKRYRQPHSKA